MKPISGAKKFGESCIRIFNVIFIQFYEKLHYSKKNNNDHLDQDMRMVKTVAVSVDNFFFFLRTEATPYPSMLIIVSCFKKAFMPRSHFQN